MSSRQRFFVQPEAVQNGSIRFSRDQARQMAAVLRLGPGSTVTALDNSGWQYEVKLDAVSGVEAVGTIRTRTLVTSEPRTKITLYVGLIRAPKLEIVLQKCTEIGVAAFVPLVAQRCVVQPNDELSPAKVERWQRIIAEAAEQSGRGKLPVLMPAVPFNQACDHARGFSLMLWEGEHETPLREALERAASERPAARRAKGPTPRPFSVNVFVGPEGGFTDEEAQRARQSGIQLVTLGPRILRAETASVTVAAAILYAQGDLG
ncbi:MAG TPA: RsmE family RNA methyltransferase [Chloroflexota bacterium]|nr:RsmE family RNA methyltransferase [Chloroflexota bacterium]